MKQVFAHLSSLLTIHDRPFLRVARELFDEVHVITFRGEALPPWLNEFSDIEIHDLAKSGRPYDDPDESRYSKRWERTWIAWHLHRYGRALKSLIGQLSPTILQGTWIPTDGYLAARSGHHPLVLAPYVTDVVQKPAVSSRLHRKIGGALRLADAIVVDSEWVREHIRMTYPDILEDRFWVASRPVDLEMFKPRVSPKDESVPTIVCHRSFEPIYDHATLFSAIDSLPRHLRFRLLLINQGSLVKTFRERADRSWWRERVEFLGRLDGLSEIADQLRRSDIYISSSLQDGTSASLLEAMASGLACVVTDIPGNREWIEKNRNGILFPRGESAALAREIESLLMNKTLREDLGSAARGRVEDRAAYSRYCTKLKEVYSRVRS